MNINRIAYTTTALGLAFAAALPGVANANPTGGSVAAGTATITNSPLNTDINQSSNKAVINWSTFNIAPNETTSFHQPGASSVTLNRIGDANPSSILGTLNANGQVMLINPNGMMFGNNSHVNVGGLVATTADINDTDFMNGNYYTFGATGNKNASITNNGHINVDDGGYAALVAPTVNNNGTITADMGKVALGGADSFVLDLTGDNLINFAVPAVSGQRGNAATVNNNGSVIADGGKVLMSADSARNAVNSVINNSGVAQARGIYSHDGVVSLVADNVNAGGTIDVHGHNHADGGTVNLTADKNLSFSGDINAGSHEWGHDGGTVNMTGKSLTLGGTVDTGGGTWGDGGTTNITTGNTMNIGSNEAYTIDSAMDHDGNVNLAANKTINLNSDIDTSGQHGNGTLNFKDGDSNNALTANLNGKIDLGNHQHLKGDATKVNVAGTGDIQNGVDVASTDGAQVNVAAGTYDGDVNVNKNNIDLRGANWNVAEGVNPGTPGAASKIDGTVNVTADNDSVRGFTIDPNNGVTVQNADNATIANNIIQGSNEHTGTGVRLSNADDATVKNNTIDGFANGVTAYGSDGAHITGNSIGTDKGVALTNSDNATVTGNTLSYSGSNSHGDTGVDIDHSDGANVANNTVNNHNTGIEADHSDDANIHNNTVANSLTGVKASNDDDLKVRNNVLVGRGSTVANGVGINASNDDDATLNGNTIVNYETGAKVASSDDVNFKNNVVTGVKTGLNANHADRIAATGNTLVGANPTQGDGMLVQNSDNVNAKLSHNTVTNFLHPRRLVNTTE